MSALPEVHYAKSGDFHIAYWTVGDGPRDLVVVPGLSSHLDVIWEQASLASGLRRLSSFSRVIMFDRRGQGLSDRGCGADTLEEEVDDVRAVMDAAGSRNAALLGVSEGCPISALFSASFPGRTTALILYGGYAVLSRVPGDSPWVMTDEQWNQFSAEVEKDWGGDFGPRFFAPGQVGNDTFKQWCERFLRASSSPGGALALLRRAREADIRPILPSIRVPTLVLHRTGDRTVPVEAGRYLAQKIPNARLVEFPGIDHLPLDADSMVDEVEEFLTGVRPAHQEDRVLATVLFTDIVDSTKLAADLGDRRWSNLLGDYYTTVRGELSRHRGKEVDTAGDGFLATFDGPARAIRCACSIRDLLRPLRLEVRAGLHTGECELIGGKVGGIAVHTGARVGALAGSGEVLVSSTVKDLVAGSGIQFADRGVQILKGVPGGGDCSRCNREWSSPV
jgi:pimeloyl-ACP methyl ester carboxylesterase